VQPRTVSRWAAVVTAAAAAAYGGLLGLSWTVKLQPPPELLALLRELAFSGAVVWVLGRHVLAAQTVAEAFRAGRAVEQQPARLRSVGGGRR